MAVGLLTLSIQIPGCQTLKDKRSQLKPLLHRIHCEFNVSISETDYHDKRAEAIITAAMASNDPKYLQNTFYKLIAFIKHHYPNLEIVRDSIELL
jgi:uncharacterized protein